MIRLAALLMLCLCARAVGAAPSAADVARLGKDLTPSGATRAGNADGSIPVWSGAAAFTEAQRSMTRAQLEDIRKNRPAELENFAGVGADKPLYTVDKSNMAKYADKLSAGQKAMLEMYPDYKLNVYRSVRGSFFPAQIDAATAANATRATLSGTDGLKGAQIGFPFPIPGNGAEVIWNHKLKFRGTALRRFNNQAIVKPDGSYTLSKLTEDVKFKYANFRQPPAADNKLLFYFLATILSPARVAGQLTLVHESMGTEGGGRSAWIYNPGIGRTNRAPDVGYDNPSVGSDGEQFNDQVDVFNGALDRYDWKLLGRREMLIAYNSYRLNSPRHKYDELIRPHHLNSELTRYELHRVWVVEATLRAGTRHSLARRTFYLDEDSWSIAAVDGYDAQGKLWKVQEAHLMTYPFLPTTTGSPEVIYDLRSGRYFVTAMSNEDAISDFEIAFEDDAFAPASLQRRARKR
ncbi:DUF1329 domain-containing protein [Hydrocarboniphaga sp.]|uniref:DUF1329 domain-containing protein n=1 Tax=Hydrocarboniphaga sp. TaxID=2033016 RepID=UPI003D0B2C23